MTNVSSLRLSGKVCVITGTGGSFGRASAVAFAREGASVFGCDLNVDALVDFAVRTFGRIDVLFNNAAMAYFNWLEDITDEEWNLDLREEIDLVFFLTRAAWPHLKVSHGVVVNTAS
jgi:NAD(P)-dependent dehydrogenase (short-subunit alcohol dehydrogenase family)